MGEWCVHLDWIRRHRNTLQFAIGLGVLLVLLLLYLVFRISVVHPWAIAGLLAPALVGLSLAEQYLAAERQHEQEENEESAP